MDRGIYGAKHSGKLWLQNHPDSALRDKMPYDIETESSKGDEYLKIDSPEEITLLDQACGSGHILVYGFELLYQIYEEAGYTASQIPQLIIEKNLVGYEIDERAAQLASFSRSEEHTSELQSRGHLVCRLLLEKKK